MPWWIMSTIRRERASTSPKLAWRTASKPSCGRCRIHDRTCQPTKIAEAIQADLKAVGIDADIVTMDWATYLAKTRDGEQDMYMLGWTGDNGDPDNFLYWFFGQKETRSRYSTPGSGADREGAHPLQAR